MLWMQHYERKISLTLTIYLLLDVLAECSELGCNVRNDFRTTMKITVINRVWLLCAENLIVSRQIVFDMLTQRRPISYKLKTQIALVCPSFHFSAHNITKTSLFNFQAKQVPWILANAQETMKSQATHISNHITMA